MAATYCHWLESNRTIQLFTSEDILVTVRTVSNFWGEYGPAWDVVRRDTYMTLSFSRGAGARAALFVCARDVPLRVLRYLPG